MTNPLSPLFPQNPFLSSSRRPPPATPLRPMASPNKPRTPEPIDLRLYPIPLSPPYPPISKEMELKRAMSASSRSALFAFSNAVVVFEDDFLVVVNKPPGIYCEALLSSFAAASASSDDIVAVPELHLANRLDRDTSGLMVITKSHKVAAKLVKAFTGHEVRKTYIAHCIGQYALGCPWVQVISGHGRSRHGAWRVYGVSDVGRTLPGGSVVKHMETTFEVLSVDGNGTFREPYKILTDVDLDKVVFAEQKVDGVDDEGKKVEVLLRAYPRSGRTHQIRLHCQYLGIPIKGDVKYGGVAQWKDVECEIHNLHAESLSFEHPMTGAALQFHAPLPSWASEAFGTKSAVS